MKSQEWRFRSVRPFSIEERSKEIKRNVGRRTSAARPQIALYSNIAEHVSYALSGAASPRGGFDSGPEGDIADAPQLSPPTSSIELPSCEVAR
jgi:hypothetical protein